MKKLDRAVKELEAGGTEADFDVGGPGEVEHLSHSIRSMVSTMRHLMDDIIQQEEQKRRSELEVLQSQINPHFLYNTLDSVIWLTENGRTDDAVVMLTSLARFFRISLSRGSSIIPIRDELEHARHYLTIQKMRYKNKFSATITAEDGVETFIPLSSSSSPSWKTPFTTAWPTPTGTGRSPSGPSGTGKTYSSRSPTTALACRRKWWPISSIPTALPLRRGAKGSGIGFRNVHQRIRLTFGADYGLTILSEPDDGTTVRIRLPALDEEAARRYRKEGGMKRKVIWQLVVPLLGLCVLFLLLAMEPTDVQTRQEPVEISVILGRRRAAPGPSPARGWNRRHWT